ncbi:hypothetical protein BOX15_Mlig017162g1 [Macrostomum lignano]|uniref:Uncharacterized protein n=1 Tax=Macrostomum lignano TaxID=282301 RepID=A0A267GDG5_9PLAT|nr:hypothetical protein BOX15_Mlig017162g1 [Macrostomum lignano]
MDPGSLDTFISIFPSQKLIDYWHARWKTSVAKNSDALAQGFALVLLSNQYQIHEQFTESNNILSFFEDLVGEKALDELQRAIYGNDVSDRSLGYQEYKEKLFSRYLPCKKIDYQQMKDDMIGYENSLLFLTTLYVAGKGNIALLQDDSSSWDCISWSKLAHWLAGQHLRSQGLSDTRISNCMRITMARLMFNCAVRKDIFEYHFLVKSFQYFEGMIERNIQKKSLTRRMDTEIIPSEQSVVAILNMAACFLELRNLTKCRALIEQARKLIKSSVKDLSFSEAYANYIDGVSHFEETSPIKSSLNGSNANNHFSASHLKKKYQTSIKLLKQNASVLRESHPDAPLTASALTMLAVVSANEAADFTTEVLVSFKEALDFESKHETRTLTATFLYQMLRTSVSMKPATSICTELFNRAEALFSARRSATAVQQENRKAESNPNTGESSKITEPSSGLDIELNDTSDIFIIIDKSRRYLDAHRQASLAHFKKLLKLCSKDTEIATQILCNLFICRHHRQSQYLNKAESRHKKSTRLIRNIFGIDLDSTVDLDASRLNGQRLFNHKELSFLVSFWLINKGMLILGEASVLSQKESASKVKKMIDFPRDRNLTSISQVAVLVRQKIADKRSKAKVKWTDSRNTIGRAKRIFQSLKLSLEDNEKPAFSFLSRYMADAFFHLNDFLAFDDRYKNDPQLVFAVVDFLKTPTT